MIVGRSFSCSSSPNLKLLNATYRNRHYPLLDMLELLPVCISRPTPLVDKHLFVRL